MVWACIAASGTGSPAFIDDRRSRMNCKVNRAVLPGPIQSNAAKPITLSLTAQLDNGPEHTIKATQE